MRRATFQRFAWALLGYNLVVIAWGAFVRVSGSGAGCGSHWPLCNGEVLPRPESVETLIELSHRLTSGLDGLLVLFLAIQAVRVFPQRSPVRWAAMASLVFLVIEALVGAGLVRFELVADDASVARALVMSAHLVNTFLLLAALAATAWFAGREQQAAGTLPGSLGTEPRRWRAAALGGAVLLLAVGISGAIAALGDTLFPVASFREGWRQDLSPGAHFLLRLRIAHPAVAAVAALALPALGSWLVRQVDAAGARLWAKRLYWLIGIQVVAGFVNLALAAPAWLQLVHLVLADLVWIAWVVLAAEVRYAPPMPPAKTEPASG